MMLRLNFSKRISMKQLQYKSHLQQRIPILASSPSQIRNFHSENDSIAPENEETRHFNKLASSWWDINGPQRILHKMNLVRMDFIQETIKNNIKLNDEKTVSGEEIYVPGYSISLLPEEIGVQIKQDQEQKNNAEYFKLQRESKLGALDIGCGGGILTESLARLPMVSDVKGLDLASDVIRVAKSHKKLDPAIVNKIQYELKALETVPNDETYDIITMFEILEHVDGDPRAFLTTALDHLNKDGVLFLSTINQDFISWFTTIFMGEYVLRIVPVGTHHLEKYINHSVLENTVNHGDFGKKKFEILNSKGGSYLPFYGWFLHNNPDFGNYFMAIKRIE